MTLRQFPLIAREGWPYIIAVLLLAIVATRLGGLVLLVPVVALLVLLVLLFRDPRRRMPSRPLAIITPVDGRIVSVRPTDKGALEREAMLVVIKINHFGTYTARSPTEGKVLSLRDNLRAGSRLTGVSGLWLRTDEGEDVVVLMIGKRRIAKPRSFVGYGERLGQGQRFAYIRLAQRAEIYMPLSVSLAVREGDRVKAGTGVLARFSPPLEDDETDDESGDDQDTTDDEARDTTG